MSMNTYKNTDHHFIMLFSPNMPELGNSYACRAVTNVDDSSAYTNMHTLKLAQYYGKSLLKRLISICKGKFLCS